MIILDTNVISELMRPEPSPRVLGWIGKQRAIELFTTSISEAEIFYGIEILSRGKRRDGLLATADAIFTKDFEGRVLGFESDAARIFSQVAAHRRTLGRPLSQADGQIAAIAQEWSARLATRNVEDFNDCGIDVVNPWANR